MAISGTGEGRSEAGECLGRAEHRGWGPLGAVGGGCGPAPSLSWLVPVPVLPASPGTAQLGPVWPTEVQIWCERWSGCHAHTGTHRDVHTGSQRHSPVCGNTDTPTHRHTDTPRTLHPPTAQIPPNIQTHSPTPASLHPLRVSPHTHTNTAAHPRTKADVPDTDTHTFTSPAHSQPHSAKVSHTQAVSHTCQCHKHSVVYTRCHTPGVTVSHTPCHTQCHPHTSPRCRLHSAGQALYRSGPSPCPGELNRAVPCRAVPSRTGRAEPCRAGPC